jgi:hypothetical protein
MLENQKKVRTHSNQMEKQIDWLQQENLRLRERQQYMQEQLQQLRGQAGESSWQDAGSVVHGAPDEEGGESALASSPADSATVARLKDAYAQLHKTCEAHQVSMLTQQTLGPWACADVIHSHCRQASVVSNRFKPSVT